MKQLPSILYHGTTALRWGLIKKSGCIAPGKDGYVFCTENLDKARNHAYVRYLRDKYDIKEFRHYYEIKPVLTDCIILGLYTYYLNRQKFRLGKYLQNVWYCYFDKIPLESLFIYEIQSLPGIFDSKRFTNVLMTDILGGVVQLRDGKLQVV